MLIGGTRFNFLHAFGCLLVARLCLRGGEQVFNYSPTFSMERRCSGKTHLHLTLRSVPRQRCLRKCAITNSQYITRNLQDSNTNLLGTYGFNSHQLHSSWWRCPGACGRDQWGVAFQGNQEIGIQWKPPRPWFLCSCKTQTLGYPRHLHTSTRGQTSEYCWYANQYRWGKWSSWQQNQTSKGGIH